MYVCPVDDIGCPYNKLGKCELDDAPTACDAFFDVDSAADFLADEGDEL